MTRYVAPEDPIVQAVMGYLVAAVRRLYDSGDYARFPPGKNERALAFRIGCTMRELVELDGLGDSFVVDMEYNREGATGDRKVMSAKVDGTSSAISDSEVYPDLVVHHRGQNHGSVDNILYVEFKHLQSVDQRDIDKLRYMTKQVQPSQLGPTYGYRLGVSVALFSSPKEAIWTLFSDGREVARVPEVS